MRMFFDAHAAIGLQQNAEALQMYTDFLNSGFKKSSYILSQLALAQYNLKGSQRIVEFILTLIITSWKLD